MKKELIKEAIHSAKCRKYYVMKHGVEQGLNVYDQRVSERESELMEVTIKCLRKELPVKPIIEMDEEGKCSAHCRNCDYTGNWLMSDGKNLFNYCPHCGRAMDWR